MAKAKSKTDTFDPVSEIFARGLQKKVMEACGISRQAIEQWQQVPWNRVLIVARITGIPRHKIRPDIYPPPKGTP